ncbi:hypothetical protein [Delftia sp. PS-11]|uniref:hypothetical protein n=1 Tax=Delftia sp. PS-11 TaxID=2767222 RepID=UPI0024562CC9|nr:hypothetical protein [Delftia sp. PS-11]
MKLILLSLVTAACTLDVNATGAHRTDAQRDAEGYAIASCLSQQADPYLKDQGDAWAAVIVQRMKGDLDMLANIAEQVSNERTKSVTPMIRDEASQGKGKTLPVLYCGEIIDRPAVRAAIQKTIAKLRPLYNTK